MTPRTQRSADPQPWHCEVEPRREHHERTLCEACYERMPACAPLESGRRLSSCDACGQEREAEFSLSLDGRVCDECYWRMVER